MIQETPFFDNVEGYKNLFNNAHDLIHFANPDGTLIYVNKTWIGLLEYSIEDIQGKSISSFVYEPDKPRFIEYRKNILKGQAGEDKITIGIQTKTGRTIKIEGFILVETENNQPIYTTGIFRDVTKHLENEAILRQNEYDLRQLLIHAPDAIIVIDHDGIIQFWNPKAELIFGWQFTEVVGKTLTQTIIPHQHREAHDRGMKRYLQTGEERVLNKTIEITALKKGGEEFFVSLTISTTRQRGKTAFIAFLRDITLQKSTQKELDKYRNELESSNRDLEQFAHVASHDMKEPIRKIKLFAERTIQEFQTTLPPKASTYLEKISTGATRLSNMVNGILTYSTLSKTKEPYEQINLSELLKIIEQDLELLISDKKAMIEYEMFPSFDGVPFLIYQLFANLITNSLKFSKKDVLPLIKITGLVTTANDFSGFNDIDKNIPHVVIILKDNGIGFSSEFSEKIFQPFATLHSKDKYEGTGLGLALCKNIVERHQGYIIAEGEQNIGATFRIVLPQISKNSTF